MCHRFVALLLAVGSALFVLSFAGRADAYPWMIRHGYTGCANCHADPSGGGLLTAYGHAQSELVLSTRYYPGNDEEDEPSRFSESLFGAVKLPESVLVGGWSRNAYIWNTADGSLVDKRFLLMRADLAAQVKVGRFRANASLGIASSGSARLTQQAWLTRNDGGVNLVSREHWVGVDVADDAVLLRGGRMALPFGLRNIEHTSWVRSETRTDINQSQQHGAAAAYTGTSLRAEGMLILGNFQLRPDLYRERGLSGYLERALGEHAAVGVSGLATRAAAEIGTRKETYRQAYGAFARVSFWKPLVILAEADALLLSVEGAGTRAGYTGFLQGDFEVVHGVHLAATAEALRRPQSGADAGMGLWGSAIWFPFPHVETRFDVIRRTGLGGPTTMTFLLQGQVYL